MFEHALVALDFSPASQPLQECLKDLVHLGVSEVTLAYVIDMGYPGGSAIAHQEYYTEKLEQLQAQLTTEGLRVHTKLATGYPPVELLNQAKHAGADMIVVGSRGHNVAQELLLGSVASEVLERATIPVLLIRINLAWDMQAESHYCELACTDLRRHLLYVTDFSATAERAFSYLEGLAKRGVEQITLLHVQDKARIERHLAERLEEFNQIDHERMEVLRQRLLTQGVKTINIEILYGSPADQILDHIDGGDYSMVVMGSQGRSLMSRIFLGSVSHRVVREATIPVLVIPALPAEE